MDNHNGTAGLRMVHAEDVVVDEAARLEAEAETTEALADAMDPGGQPTVAAMQVAMEVEAWLNDGSRAVLRSLNKTDRETFGKMVDALQHEQMKCLTATTDEMRAQHQQSATQLLNSLLVLGQGDRLAMFNTVVDILGAISGLAAKMAVTVFLEDITAGKYSDKFKRFEPRK